MKEQAIGLKVVDIIVGYDFVEVVLENNIVISVDVNFPDDSMITKLQEKVVSYKDITILG